MIAPGDNSKGFQDLKAFFIKDDNRRSAADRLQGFQEVIWQVRSEMEGVGALLASIGPGAEISAEELFGLGAWIKRLAASLEYLEERLGLVNQSPISSSDNLNPERE